MSWLMRKRVYSPSIFKSYHCLLQNKVASNQLPCQCRAYRIFSLKSYSQRAFQFCQSSKRTLASKPSLIRGPITWASLAAFLLGGGSIVMYVRHLKEEKEKAKQKERIKSIGMASIGGPFELVDTNGKTVTNEDLLGKWVLMYFGFCHCPDICPDQLEKMTEIVNRINDMSGLPNIQPIFITVDPHRDSVEHIKEYLKDFHPTMIGLTGTEEQVKKVCKAYRVYYSSGPKDEDEDYIVDHTIIMYLLNPEGKFNEYFGQNRTIQEVVGAISTKMVLSRKKYN